MQQRTIGCRSVNGSVLLETEPLNRENLYRILSDQGNPELASLYVILDTLD